MENQKLDQIKELLAGLSAEELATVAQMVEDMSGGDESSPEEAKPTGVVWF